MITKELPEPGDLVHDGDEVDGVDADVVRDRKSGGNPSKCHTFTGVSSGKLPKVGMLITVMERSEIVTNSSRFRFVTFRGPF